MNIEALDSMEAMEALEPAWRELWLNCPRATPFQAPQWLLPWTRYLFGGGQIRGLALRENGELIGFVPLFIWGIEQRTVSFLGAGISDYGDLLFAPNREPECVSAVRSYLDSEHDQWDIVNLEELRAGSGLLEAGEMEACSVCPVLETYRYPADLDPKHRNDFRRAQNRLLKHGAAEFTNADAESFAQHFDEFVRLHRMRWPGFDARLELFHRETAHRFLASGNLRLSLLRVDGAAIASMYCFTSGKTLYCYLSGFDPAQARLSPGSLLLGWTIDQAIADGLQNVDFLRKPESYKYLWGARDRINYKIRRERNP